VSLPSNTTTEASFGVPLPEADVEESSSFSLSSSLLAAVVTISTANRKTLKKAPMPATTITDCGVVAMVCWFVLSVLLFKNQDGDVLLWQLNQSPVTLSCEKRKASTVKDERRPGKMTGVRGLIFRNVSSLEFLFGWRAEGACPVTPRPRPLIFWRENSSTLLSLHKRKDTQPLIDSQDLQPSCSSH